MIKPKTQKAKGIINGLREVEFFYGIKRLAQFMRIPHHYLVQSSADVKSYGSVYPRFARPCPVIPRHGFIESRTVKNQKEVIKLIKEVKKEDAEGEIILGPHLPNVKYNAVFVDSGNLSIGFGNAGATGGVKSVSFPVVPQVLNNVIRQSAGLTEQSAVFVEAVYDHAWILTQLRGGPKIESSKDFVPRRMEVSRVVKPHDDLLKWESEVKSFKCGTVVYGNGHTLASHAAIHCALNNVPFITSHKPIKGEILTPKNSKRSLLNRNQFRRGVRAGLELCKDKGSILQINKMFLFSVCVLHNWNYLKASPEADWILGAASIILGKIASTLAHGEMRNQDGDPPSRRFVYHKTMARGIEPIYELPEMFENFMNGTWTSGFGGFAWATCAWYSHLLCRTIINIHNRKNKNVAPKEVSELVGAINKIVNIVHNGGWWLDKIAIEEDMNQIASDPGWSAFLLGDVFMDVRELVKKLKVNKKKLPRTQITRRPFSTISNVITWVFMRGISSYNSEINLGLIDENGSAMCSSVKVSRKEIEQMIQYRKDLYPIRKIAFNLKKDGSFRLAPTNKKMNIKKIFRKG
jgi:hypothetical protein